MDSLERMLKLAGVICNESDDNVSLDVNEQLVYSLAKNAAEILSTKDGFTIEPVTDDYIYYTGHESDVVGCNVAGSYSGTTIVYTGDSRNPDTEEGEVGYTIDDIILSFEYHPKTKQLNIKCNFDGRTIYIAKVDDPKSVPSLIDYAANAAKIVNQKALEWDDIDVPTHKGSGGIRSHWYR